jgi:putative serine protease PepD
MGSPRHLWTGPWRDDSDRARESAAEAAELRRPPQPQPQGPATTDAAEPDAGARDGRRGEPPRRITLLLGIAVMAAAIAGGAFAAGMLVDGSRSSGPEPLPAVASQPIKPHKGQSQAGAIYAAASPAVVSIRTDVGEGTGFLIDGKGTLVTNDHVVGTSTHVLVRFGQDGNAIDGDVLGADPSSDLAVVSIDPAQVPKGARPLRLADSRAVQVGELVVAIGNPFGLDRTATEGIVSGIGRSIQSPNGFAIDDVIQTDAPINPGNSGGPLLDDGANVIGVNSQIATAGVAGNIGIGFAIPSNTVRQIVPRLEKGQTIARPWLGVTTTPASPTHPDGAQVAAVVPSGPAAHAGIHTGDVIKRIDGQPVQSPDDVVRAIGGGRPGDQATVVVERNGKTQTLHVTLGKRPARIP